MKQASKLAILDWGIGGIGIFKLIKKNRPGRGIVYFSDTGATPYGKMSGPELTARLDQVIDFLRTEGVTHLVIGCNAASTAIPFLNTGGMRIEGMIDTAVDFAAKHKLTRLGLIGGRRTVLSGVYRKGFAKRGIKVEQRIAQPLSALIESGDVSSKGLRDECERILSPLRNCSHILLACTHYPAISNTLKDYLAPNSVLIDPAAAMVDKVASWKLASQPWDIFLTTGDPAAMKIAAKNAFGVEIHQASPISIT